MPLAARKWNEYHEKRRTSASAETFRAQPSSVWTPRLVDSEEGSCGTQTGRKTMFVPVNYQENAVNDMFVLPSRTRKKRSGRAQRHLHFHTFLHPEEKSICLSGEREIYTLLFGNDAQTAATEPADVFDAFSSKDKCKFTLKREAIFTETHQRSVFLLLCLITVFTRVSR